MKRHCFLIVCSGFLLFFSCLSKKQVVDNTAIAQTTTEKYALIDTFFLRDYNTCIDNYKFYDLYQIVHIITKAKNKYKDSLEIEMLYNYYPINEQSPKSFTNQYILKFNQVIKDSLPNDSIVMRRTFIPQNDYFIMRGTFHDISSQLNKFSICNKNYSWRISESSSNYSSGKSLTTEEASQFPDTLYYTTISYLSEYYENIGVYLIYKWKIRPSYRSKK